MILYINGQQVDTDMKTEIAQTLQCNDINSVETREASYTNRIKLPKTANNIRIMEFLTIPGNNSTVPYRKNLCSLFSDTGECFVYNGWAVISDAGNAYEAVIYDGIIELYKHPDVENTSLADLGLDELNHQKGIDEVISTWDLANNKKYLYILADYNGNTGDTEAGSVNIDYLVPSVPVSYLWQKIFDKTGFTYQGAIFDSEEFKNLYMTFPKGITSTDVDEEVFATGESAFYPDGLYNSGYYVRSIGSSELNEDYIYEANSYRHIRFKKGGKYRIDVSGIVYTDRDFRIILGKNASGINDPYNVPTFHVIKDYQELDEDITNARRVFEVEEDDTVCVVLKKIKTTFLIENGSTVFISIVKVTENEFDFQEAFSDFKTKDFLKEIVNRFGLTIFKDRYSSNYNFLTLQEILQTPDNNLDWSDKFISKEGENYIYGSYAKQNWFRYNYNDKESNHNDSFIPVDNENLEDSKTLIQSKIYSPERLPVIYLNRRTNVYPIWEKEVDEDEVIKYKALDKRYYFLRAIEQTGTITVTSESLAESDTANTWYIESFWRLPFFDILQDFYNALRLILENTTIVKTKLWLNDTDIINLDFKKLVYIKQLSSYFLLNKIENYRTGRPTTCEMIRVNYSLTPEAQPAVTITDIEQTGYFIRVYFDLTILVDTIKFQVLGYGTPGVWSSSTYVALSPIDFTFTPPGTFMVRIEADGQYSNEVEVKVP